MVSLNIYKNSTNKFRRKTGFKIENLTMKLTVNRPPKTKRTISKLVCIFSPNFVVLAEMGGELWRGKARNGINLAFQVKFDLAGQGQSPHKTIGTLTKLFCIFCPNLGVLAWTRGELWHGQAQGWQTHTQTQATTIPEGQKWPWVKSVACHNVIMISSNNQKRMVRTVNPPWPRLFLIYANHSKTQGIDYKSHTVILYPEVLGDFMRSSQSFWKLISDLMLFEIIDGLRKHVQFWSQHCVCRWPST